MNWYTTMADSFPSVRTVLNVFTEEECRRIIGHGLNGPLTPGYAPGMRIDPDRRSSMVRFIYADEGTHWIFARLWKTLEDQGLKEGITTLNFVQFTEYKAEYGGHFGLHRDTEVFYHATDTTNLKRKTTCVIQLSDPLLYEGGDLEFVYDKGKILTGQKDRGCGILFPSKALHRANRVTAGERYSLVAWFEGPKL
jgi:PKHD-type hydroxylase